ncbi:uncharacterized protein LOC123507192 [Portunus trituberculatus]|uniref:uncharacterized protein LOC123507192 n=1 Tax=Portunus trituberculatus TaxID=210409 RepID=UPI001E1D0789|nr:uncharacterized protein LOC123507192 [Portunus trituberculatus]
MYPPIPMHALSKKSISRLQKVQNSALRFALNTRWDDFRTTESLHEEASIQAINVRLTDLASSIWQRIADEGWDQFSHLQELHDAAPDRQHTWFPRSLLALEMNPNPAPKYKTPLDRRTPEQRMGRDTCEMTWTRTDVGGSPHPNPAPPRRAGRHCTTPTATHRSAPSDGTCRRR